MESEFILLIRIGGGKSGGITSWFPILMEYEIGTNNIHIDRGVDTTQLK